MWSYIDGTSVKPMDRKDVDKYAEALKTWNKNNSKVITWINNSVSQSIGMQLAKFDTAQEVWEHLKRLYEQSNFAKREEQRLVQLLMALRDDFEGLRGAILHRIPLPKVDSVIVQTDKHFIFPLVYKLIELALILPVSTVSVERAFSAMKIIKTKLRNKINDEWFNDLMICYTEREIFKSLDDVDIIRTFTAKKSQKRNLPHSFM
ncbi:unnamed protein product [Trifolium pratense]|uniref:Uncharacterized protein n=1 Tax=Trifolium pratense TaxID=57577 RepID=A0ACB0LYK8_TRIPR|nr:unnamed protein product [Trifolium pratense]